MADKAKPSPDLTAEPQAQPPDCLQSWPVTISGCAAWLHPAALGPITGLGVVVSAPLGRDGRCAHLPLRLLAERLARSGVAVLRYDHLGAGDSQDLPVGADALPVWRDGLEQAIETLRSVSGVERVIVVGLRFGATLAALCADMADGLVLLAPIIRGSAWLRELKLATAVLAPTTVGSVADEFDADGLWLSPATVKSLSQLDLKSVGLGSDPVLLVAQGPAVIAYGQAMAREGARITLKPFDGFDELFDDSHSNLAPWEVFEKLTHWVLEAVPCSVSTSPSPVETWPSPGLRASGWKERPVIFGAGLHGVYCEPEGQARPERAVLLCNTGGDPRAGIGGFATSTARALAQQGVSALRFDFAGLGDSPAADGALRSHVYETSRRPDFDAAISLLQANGVQKIIIAGVCSGGYHALNAAFEDERVDGVLMINTVILAWRAGTSLAVGDRDQGRSTKAYLNLMADPRTWSRLLRGGVDAGAVMRTLGMRIGARLRAVSKTTPEAQVKAQIANYAARGGRIRFVVGSEDPALDMVEAHFGPGGRQFTAMQGMSLCLEPGLDHGLALRASREKARAQVLNFVAEF